MCCVCWSSTWYACKTCQRAVMCLCCMQSCEYTMHTGPAHVPQSCMHSGCGWARTTAHGPVLLVCMCHVGAAWGCRLHGLYCALSFHSCCLMRPAQCATLYYAVPTPGHGRSRMLKAGLCDCLGTAALFQEGPTLAAWESLACVPLSLVFRRSLIPAHFYICVEVLEHSSNCMPVCDATAHEHCVLANGLWGANSMHAHTASRCGLVMV